MAYPRGQFQQPPSSSPYTGRQAPYANQQQQQHTYQNVPQSRNRHESQFQEFSSRPDRNFQESYRSGLTHGSPQWPEQTAEWSSEAQQPYKNQGGYGGPTSSYMPPRQDGYEGQTYEQDNARQLPAAAPYSQNQNTSWIGRSPQRQGQQQHFNQPRGYGLTSHPTNNYDRANSPVQSNGHYVEAQSSNGNHNRSYHNQPESYDPQIQFDQQQRSRPMQDVRAIAGRGQGTTATQTQQNVPNASSGRPKKPSQLMIDFQKPVARF